ncbi:PopZ family protein [Microvirga sp. G4-2]|uniref:PopZ family protein n=1 Tax=Microvirga sp. G4-2 TaxID=3434467 RepID=UPI00404508B9
MEDILASIRRIISDDHEPAPEPTFREPETTPLKTVLDITEQHVTPGLYPQPLPSTAEERPFIQDGSFQEVRPIARLVENDEAERPVHPAAVAVAQAPQALVPPCERNPGEALLSQMTEASVSEAFGRLSAVRAQSQPQTVEGLMKEMLRPMLKAWLDENLPTLVERLVKAEIERVTRG